jgi:hypothetical protein
MRAYKLIIIFLTGFSCIACGQNTNKKNKIKNHNFQKNNK